MTTHPDPSLLTVVSILYFRSDSRSVNRHIKGEVDNLDLLDENEYMEVHQERLSPCEDQERLQTILRLFTSPSNPLIKGNKQEFLRTNRLHVSMTSGDVVMLMDRAYVLTGLGFKRVC